MPVGNEAALVAAAVAGRSLEEMARAAGISVSTVQRRLKQPDVVAAVREAIAQSRQERLGQLGVLALEAIRRVGALVNSDDESVALRASHLVLSNVQRLDAVADLEERLAALEVAAERRRENDEVDGVSLAVP